MAENLYSIRESTLTDIADAIRNKNVTLPEGQKLFPMDMPQAIQDIEGGAIPQYETAEQALNDLGETNICYYYSDNEQSWQGSDATDTAETVITILNNFLDATNVEQGFLSVGDAWTEVSGYPNSVYYYDGTWKKAENSEDAKFILSTLDIEEPMFFKDSSVGGWNAGDQNYYYYYNYVSGWFCYQDSIENLLQEIADYGVYSYDGESWNHFDENLDDMLNQKSEEGYESAIREIQDNMTSFVAENFDNIVNALSDIGYDVVSKD